MQVQQCRASKSSELAEPEQQQWVVVIFRPQGAGAGAGANAAAPPPPPPPTTSSAVTIMRLAPTPSWRASPWLASSQSSASSETSQSEYCMRLRRLSSSCLATASACKLASVQPAAGQPSIVRGY